MSTVGRGDRKNRLENCLPGVWGSFSQDYVRLCILLYAQSAVHAKKHKGNVSSFVIAGIPLLFSALRALLIECASGMYGWSSGEDKALLKRLAADANELKILKDSYNLSTDLMGHVALLYDVRNEIIHPAHRPTGTHDNTPKYLRPLKDMGLLQSFGDPKSDYPWMAQLQSHRLFQWGFSTTEQVASAVIERHHEDKDMGLEHAASYSKFRDFDL